MQKTEPGTRSDWYKGLGGWVFPRLSDGTSLRKGHWSRPGWCEVWEGEGQGLPGRETSRHKGPKGRTHLQWKNLHVAVGQRARGSDEMKSDLGWGEMGRQGFTSQSRVWTLFWRAWRAHWDCYTGCRESKEAGEDVCIRQEPTTGGGGVGVSICAKLGCQDLLADCVEACEGERDVADRFWQELVWEAGSRAGGQDPKICVHTLTKSCCLDICDKCSININSYTISLIQN